MTDSIPFQTSTKPCPPASTTPAFLSTGSISGVCARASCALTRISFHICAAVSCSSCAASCCACSPASLATVRMVPSVGFITALYAAVTPIDNAFAMSFASASCLPSKPLEKPRNSRERITPEFPLAPRSKAEAAFLATCSTVGSSRRVSSSRFAALMVIDIFVPVSPSGTGNTLSASTCCLQFEMLFAPEINASLS